MKKMFTFVALLLGMQRVCRRYQLDECVPNQDC